VAELAVHATESRSDDTKVSLNGIEELVADKGYLSGAVLKRVKGYGVRSYIPEKRQKGKRHWQGKMEGATGGLRKPAARWRRLRQKPAETAQRTGGTKVLHTATKPEGCGAAPARTREHLKRQLIHVGAFNLSLILRKILGAGTPRELKNRATRLLLQIFRLLHLLEWPKSAVAARTTSVRNHNRRRPLHPSTLPDLLEFQLLPPRLLRISLPLKRLKST